uniref:Dual specificity protein phosphatase 15 n=1 Tax=Saimiri boliviensis boliviensis TaxID=39432 RepID=A0A2K6TLM1_SAIBB
YLGNFIDAKDLDQLGRNKITHIISIHESPQPLLQDITYLRIPVADTPEVPIKKHFKECINFIHCCRLDGGNCLVHCFAGISRSTTIVTAYVMTVTGLGWRDVLEAIKATRPIANPNPGFRQQLEEFGWGSSRKGTRHRISNTSGAQCPPMTSPAGCTCGSSLAREATRRTAQRCRLSPRAALPPRVPDASVLWPGGPGPPEQLEKQLIMAHQVQVRPRILFCTRSALAERPDGSSLPQRSCLRPKQAASSPVPA